MTSRVSILELAVRHAIGVALVFVVVAPVAHTQDVQSTAVEDNDATTAESPPATDYFTGLYSCRTDSDCGWDHPCSPLACVPQELRATDVTCTSVSPPPGTCSCVDGWCTLRPTDTSSRRSGEGCATDADCGINISMGSCHLDPVMGQPPIDLEGPLCSCDAESARCVFEWVEPVRCESFADCWYEREPRLRAVPAREPRERPVEPCVDAEVDSICVERDGGNVCRVVAWEC